MIFWSNWIWYEQFKEQLFIVHKVDIESDWLQFNSIIETIWKFWLRRNCIGNDKDDFPGMSIIFGE